MGEFKLRVWRRISHSGLGRSQPTAYVMATVKYLTTTTMPQRLRCGALAVAWPLYWHTEAVGGVFNRVLSHHLSASFGYTVVDQRAP